MIPCTLAMVILAGGMPSLQPTQMDDRDVVQAVVLSHLQSVPAQHRYGVVQSQWAEHGRGNYSQDLRDAIADIRSEMEQSGFNHDWQHQISSDKVELSKLVALRNRKSEPDSFTPSSVRPLGSYSWAKEVKFDENVFSGWRRITSSDRRFKKLINAGFVGSFAPPEYSVDGQSCIVKVSFPWSVMHGGASTYVVERSAGKWLVVFERTVDYL